LTPLPQILTGVLLVGIAVAPPDPLTSSLRDARRTYDLSAAIELRASMREALKASPSPELLRLLTDKVRTNREDPECA